MDNFNDAIGNRTLDTSACGAVFQPTAPPRIPAGYNTEKKPISKFKKELEHQVVEIRMGKHITVEF
jgi:hypothetical protein